MQLAGSMCALCRKSVPFDADGTWCARCSTVFHRECLSNAQDICPSCGQAYEPPEKHFVFCQICPECFRPTTPPLPHCAACKARTRWDTQAEYEAFVEQMKDAFRVSLLRGVAGTIGGLLCLLGLVGMFGVGSLPAVRVPLVCLLGFMFLTTDGLLSLARSRKISRFR